MVEIFSLLGQILMSEFMFVFDQAKSESNKAKHGIDFVVAQRLWDDARLFEFPGRSDAEHRRIVVGMIAEKQWSAVFTRRDDAIRLISVRRARTQEVRNYDRR